jgi:hypothetical protein
MTVALLTLNAISLATIAVTVFYGNIIPQGGGALGRHLTLALIAILLALFTHTMTFFYFIGVGSSIRNAVRETGVGAGQLEESRRLKSQVFPWVGGAMLTLMIAFILGGAAHTRALPSWVHGGLGYLALIAGLVAFLVEALFLMRQNRVVHDLEQRLLAHSKTSHPEAT